MILHHSVSSCGKKYFKMVRTHPPSSPEFRTFHTPKYLLGDPSISSSMKKRTGLINRGCLSSGQRQGQDSRRLLGRGQLCLLDLM